MWNCVRLSHCFHHRFSDALDRFVTIGHGWCCWPNSGRCRLFHCDWRWWRSYTIQTDDHHWMRRRPSASLTRQCSLRSNRFAWLMIDEIFFENSSILSTSLNIIQRNLMKIPFFNVVSPSNRTTDVSLFLFYLQIFGHSSNSRCSQDMRWGTLIESVVVHGLFRNDRCR